MGINNIIKNALNTNWNYTDEFIFTFNNNAFSLNTSLSPQDIWDMCVINIDTPQLSASINDIVIGGTRRIYSTMFPSFNISITFRDLEGLKLKDFFTKIWAAQYTRYFDEIKSTIQLSSQGSIIFHSDDCLISDISQSQFNNDNNQIVEFTVSFICPSLSTNSLNGFGKPGKTTL